MIRWLPSTVENAQGPHVHDPRSGEILESDILMYHNVMNLVTHWYFVQAGPLDPRAKTLPLPDALMGELVRYVVAHEVGHTLGLPHNMKASSLYPFDKLRDPQWLKDERPHADDHGLLALQLRRAARGRACRAADLIPKIGPYDLFAIKWGYQPIAGATSADAEKKTLDEWARQQDQTPWLRFSTSNSAGSDPGELTEAVGDADAIQATTLGLKNLERVGAMLLSATVQARRAVRRPAARLHAAARPVGARDEPRLGDRRRLRLAAEARRPGAAWCSRRSPRRGRWRRSSS